MRSKPQSTRPAQRLVRLSARAGAAAIVAVSGLTLVALGAVPASAAPAPSGLAYAWGDNSTGSFGDPSLSLNLLDTPQQLPLLPGGATVQALSTTQSFSVALGSDGNLYSWGDNTYGELGTGSTASESASPVEVALPVGVTATAVATSSATAMAIGSDGNVYAWGDNTYGELGQGTYGGSSNTPEVVENPGGLVVTAVAAGSGTMMELTSAGEIYVWGAGGDGEMGDGGSSNRDLPAETFVLDTSSVAQTVAAIAVGQGYCVVATTGGAVYTWGFDGQGELGDFTGYWDSVHTDVNPTPTAVTLPTGGGAVAVSAGAFDAYALTSTGQIDAWGDSDRGGIGNGSPPYSFWAEEPTAVDAPPDGGTFTQVSAGADSVSALTSDGNVDTWGVGASGQLANGTLTTLAFTPVQASLPAGVLASAVASGGDDVYALTDAAPPVITSPDTATFVYGQAGSFTVTTTGTPAPTITHTGALPAGLNFTDNGDGTATIAGTPTVSGGEIATGDLYVENGVTPFTTQILAITVDMPPVFTSAAVTTVGIGIPVDFEVDTSSYPFAALSAGTLPPGLSFTDSGSGWGTISGTPTGPTGTFFSKLTATNGVGSPVVQILEIKVHQPPVFTSGDTATFTPGTSGSFAITTTSSPVATITESGNLPTGVRFKAYGNGKATLRGTPAPNAGGIYDLTLTASNPVQTTQSFTLIVPGHPVFTGALDLYFTIGQNSSSQLTTRPGYPGPETLTASKAMPTGLTFTDNGNGTATVSGTPTGAPRVITLKVTATNSAGSSVKTVKLHLDNPSTGSTSRAITGEVAP